MPTPIKACRPTHLIMSDAKEHRQNSSLWVSDQSTFLEWSLARIKALQWIWKTRM